MLRRQPSYIEAESQEGLPLPITLRSGTSMMMQLLAAGAWLRSILGRSNGYAV